MLSLHSGNEFVHEGINLKSLTKRKCRHFLDWKPKSLKTQSVSGSQGMCTVSGERWGMCTKSTSRTLAQHKTHTHSSKTSLVFSHSKHCIFWNLSLYYRTCWFVMPLNLLEDTRSQAGLDKVIATLKEKAKKQIWKGGGWLRAGLGFSRGFYFWFFTIPAPNSERNRSSLLSKAGQFGGFFHQGSFPRGWWWIPLHTGRDTGMEECSWAGGGQRVALQFLLSFWLLKCIFMDNKLNFFSPSGDCFAHDNNEWLPCLSFPHKLLLPCPALPCPAEEGLWERLGAVWPQPRWDLEHLLLMDWVTKPQSQNSSHNSAALRTMRNGGKAEDWHEGPRQWQGHWGHREERNKIWNTKGDHLMKKERLAQAWRSHRNHPEIMNKPK